MMSEQHPHHFSDPNLHFFQVLEEARRHRHHREAPRDRSACSSSSSSGRFKLHKRPIGKDQEKKKSSSSSSSRSRKPRWSWSSWRSALDLFFVFKAKWPLQVHEGRQGQPDYPQRSSAGAMAMQSGRSVSGPLYLADSRCGMPRLRHRGYSRSGPLAARVPYVCLSPDFRTATAPPPPLYLVT